MIAMPIAALTLGATLIRTSVPTLEEHVTGEMGSAELRLSVSQDVDVAALSAALPAGSRLVEIKQWNQTLVVDGSLVWASVLEPSIPIDQRPLPGWYVLMDGRAPASPGEAAVDPRALDVFDVRIGEDLTIGERTFRVVGVAARPQQMWDPLIVVGPGTLPSQTSLGRNEVFGLAVLVDLPQGTDSAAVKEALVTRLLALVEPPEAERGREPRSSTRQDAIAIDRVTVETHGEQITVAGITVETREEVAAATFLNDVPTLTGVSFGGTVLVLFGTGLIAAAAFAVGIRRQLRMLGLLGATGGEPAHVRAAVLLGGTSLGLTGAMIGVATGIAGAYAVTPHLHRFTHSLPGAVVLHWPTLAGAALLGVVAATAAAAWPARMAVRVSTLDALAARMAQPRPPGRLARRGLIGVIVGAVLTGVTVRPGGNQVVLAAGLVLMVGGFLVSVPLLLQTAGRFAPRLPTAPRLAVRETARYGRRTGTAIAAAAMALALPVGVAALSLSEEAFQRRSRWIGPDHLLIGDYSAKPYEPTGAPEELLAKIRETLPGAIAANPRMAVLDLERYPPPPEMGEVEEWSVWVEGPLITHHESGVAASVYREGAPIFIGGPDLLRALHAEDGIPALASGKVIGIGPNTVDDGVVHLPLSFYNTGDPPRVRLPAVEAGDERYYSSDTLPRYVVSRKGAAALGLLPSSQMTGETLVAARAPLTPQQIQAVKQAATEFPGAYVRTLEDFLPGFGLLRIAAIGAAAIVALAIVAVTISLVGAEARHDQAILVAVGAAPRARRRIAGARAGLVALLAGVIAVPTGFAPIAVIQWSRPDGFPIVVPWTTMALVALAVPLVAAAFGGLTSRSPKASAMLQPIY